MGGIRAWFDKHMGGGGMASAKKHAEGVAHTVRGGGEAVIVGALLGAADSHLKTGLDYSLTMPGTPPAGQQAKTTNVPVDGVLMAAGLISGVVLAAHEDGIGQDARNIGMAAAAVLTYRKTRDYTAKQMRAQNQTPGYATTLNFAQTLGMAGQSPPAAPAAHGAYGFNGEGYPQQLEAQNDPILALAQRLG